MPAFEFGQMENHHLNIEIVKYSSEKGAEQVKLLRRRYDFHAIYLIQKGQGIQEIDFEDYQIGKHQLMVIPKGTVHLEKEIHHWQGYCIRFRENFFSTVQKELLNGFLQYAIALRKMLIPIPQKQVEQLEYYFKLLEVEQHSYQNQNQTFILQNLMLALLNKLEGMIQSLPEATSFIDKRKPFQRFIALVEQYYTSQKPLDFYTTELQLTSRKLNDILKRITGQTAAHYIIDRIIIQAKRELCFSEQSIKEIANQLGYESPYYFSRIFKKKTQLSPEQYRGQFAE